MWFSANILFKGSSPSGSNSAILWEEQVILIQANTESEAQKKATSIGSNKQHEYRVDSGEIVRWIFDGIERVQQIESQEIYDGIEVFSRFLRNSEVESIKTPFSD